MANINGTPTDNNLNGTNQDDVLNSNWSGGDDKMYGKNGHDQYNVNSVGDRVIESGTGIDSVFSRLDSYKLTSNVENLFLAPGGNKNGFGNVLNNVIEGNNGDNLLSGYAGNDKLHGNLGKDNLNGGAGNDTLDGGKDDDVLNGHSGTDTIIGGIGADRLSGGLGADSFIYLSVFESSDSAKSDIIINFKGSENDKIDLSKIDANAITDENEAFAASAISFDPSTQMFTADVINSPIDLTIKLIGLEAGFDINTDVIL